VLILGDQAQEVANSPLQEFSLLKAKKSEAPKVIKKIKALSFPVLKPLPMELKRQEYLYHNIRPLPEMNLKILLVPSQYSFYFLFLLLTNSLTNK